MATIVPTGADGERANIKLDSGELWLGADGKPREWGWQDAQRQFAEGLVPAANVKEKRNDKDS